MDTIDSRRSEEKARAWDWVAAECRRVLAEIAAEEKGNTMREAKDRRPHYECDHRTTICRDCDGSAPATSPWRTFTERA